MCVCVRAEQWGSHVGAAVVKARARRARVAWGQKGYPGPWGQENSNPPLTATPTSSGAA